MTQDRLLKDSRSLPIPPRVPCCVPFCRRTAKAASLKPGDNQYICQVHWATVPRQRRRVYARARRTNNQKASEFIWARLVALVIERSAT